MVESDKADMDVESFQDGYLAAVLMPAGSTAPVGETIGLIVETEAEIADAKAKAPSTAPAAASPAPTPAPAAVQAPAPTPAPTPVPAAPAPVAAAVPPAAPVANGRIVASPRAKKLATQMGVDLSTVRGSCAGSGPDTSSDSGPSSCGTGGCRSSAGGERTGGGQSSGQEVGLPDGRGPQHRARQRPPRPHSG